MKFKVDENLPAEVAGILDSAGHDALTVHAQHLAGAPDEAIAAVCRREGRALLTLDTDFADLRAYPPHDYPGLVVFRLGRQDKAHVLRVLRGLVPALSVERLDQRLWIVEEDRIRIRGGLEESGT